MSARPDTVSALARLDDALPGLEGGRPWLEWRRAALAGLATAGLPTPRDDAWKYANLRLLERRDLAPAPPRPVATAILDALPEASGARLVFVDGRLQPGLSATALPAGVTLAPTAGHAPPAALPPTEADERLRSLNAVLRPDARTLRVARGSLPATLEVVHVATGGGAYPSVTLALEAGAALTLVEYQVGVADAEAFVASCFEATLAEGARLTHTTVQLAGDRSVVLDDVRIGVGRDARYEHRLVALGGQLARLDLHVALQEPGAAAALAGLLFADARRELHVRTHVDHRAPHGTSDQLYRGVAAGRGRGSYDGKVLVREGAAGTQSRQSSRNLLLSSDAAFDTRPQLEINADDVRCGHGATTGTLDENMLFYLLTRGLDRETARALLTYAFAEDVLCLLGDGALRSAIEARALSRLPAADTIREFVA